MKVAPLDKEDHHAERDDGPAIPALDSLGRDLLITTRWQRWLACARPMLGVVVFGVAAHLEWWWLTPVVVFVIFVAVVTVTHDVVHGTLGLSPRQGEPPKSIERFSLGFDSWGGDPFVVWLDGIQFE